MVSDDGNGDGRLTDEGLRLWPRLISFAETGYEEDPLANTAINVLEPGVAFIGGSRKELEDGIDGGVEAVDPLGRTMQDMNLDESHHLDSANNLCRLDGDWILWPAASR